MPSEAATEAVLGRAQRQLDAESDLDNRIQRITEWAKNQLAARQPVVLTPRNRSNLTIWPTEVDEAITETAEYTQAMSLLGDDNAEAGRLMQIARERTMSWLLDECYGQWVYDMAFFGEEVLP